MDDLLASMDAVARKIFTWLDEHGIRDPMPKDYALAALRVGPTILNDAHVRTAALWYLVTPFER